METQINKNSVFSGIFPSGEPAPQPAHVTQAPKPAVSDEQVAALNKKIEEMERNIVGQLEKKLSEHVPPPPSPPPSALAPAVLLKMTEMENRLKDFQERFLLGAAQAKNMEESKIGARREIADLLKVVREQQKYSELDRQMHDQLEKAWSRVEEMEKRMMEVYTAAAKKPAEPAAQAASPAEIAAEVRKAVNAGFEERLKPLETALKNAAAQLSAEMPAEVSKAVALGVDGRLAPLETLLASVAAKNEAASSTSRGIAGRVAELSEAVDVRLAGFSAEIRQLHIEAFAGKERVEDILAEVKKDVLSSVKEAFAESGGAIVRHIDTIAIDERERLDELGKMLVAHVDELAARGRDAAVKIDVLESYVKSGNESVVSAVSSARQQLEKALLARIDEAAFRAAAENAAQLEKIKGAFGLAASHTSALAAVAESISGIEAGLGGTLACLKAFVKDLEPVNLEAVLGVSGAIIRRSFESAGELAAGLERETVLLARAKGEIEANLKSLAHKSGGEGK